MIVVSTIKQMPLIRAVLFDYGLVLTGPPDPPAWRSMQSLLAADDSAFHDAYWGHRLSYDLGALNGKSYWQAVAGDLQRGLDAEKLIALLNADLRLWTQPNQPMIDWATALQRDAVPTGILSNMGDAMEDGIMASIPWMAGFPTRIFSHRLGIVKPDERIYRYTISALGVSPAETLFIDDRLENVEAALAAGLNAIQYSGHSDFLREFSASDYTGLPHPKGSQLDACAKVEQPGTNV